VSPSDFFYLMDGTVNLGTRNGGKKTNAGTWVKHTRDAAVGGEKERQILTCRRPFPKKSVEQKKGNITPAGGKSVELGLKNDRALRDPGGETETFNQDETGKRQKWG